MPSWWVDFFNGDQATIVHASEQTLLNDLSDEQPLLDSTYVSSIESQDFPDGYWDDEIDRQFHHEVKGG